jgi:hypothetical protein
MRAIHRHNSSLTLEMLPSKKKTVTLMQLPPTWSTLCAHKPHSQNDQAHCVVAEMFVIRYSYRTPQHQNFKA